MIVTNFVIQQRHWALKRADRLNLTGTKATFDGTILVCYFRSKPGADVKETLSQQIYVNLELTIKRTDVIKILQSGQTYILNGHGQVFSFEETDNQWAVTIGVLSVWYDFKK